MELHKMKSHRFTTPRVQYALDHSTKLNKHVEELMELSLKHPFGLIIGARGVLHTCTAIIEMIQAKNVLDIGLFTGVSALTWALAIPADGKVISMDVREDEYNIFGKRIIEEFAYLNVLLYGSTTTPMNFSMYIGDSGVADKIDIRIQPALQTLHDLVGSGHTEAFDFVFIDANKSDYANYYNLCLQLLRPGGVIAVDNSNDYLSSDSEQIHAVTCYNVCVQAEGAFFGESVLKNEKDEFGTAIDQLNKLASTNPRMQSVLLPIEDGLHIIVKKIGK